MIYKINRLTSIIAFLLLVVSVAGASPIVTTRNNGFCTEDTPDLMVYLSGELVGNVNSRSTVNKSVFLELPVYSADLGCSKTDYVKPLPAAPTAVLMVLTGFLCISVVRDRRLWLVLLAGLLWASQIGVQAVPQFMLYLGRKINYSRRVAALQNHLFVFKRNKRPRCDIEGTSYIGLLHYLAGIPNGRSDSYPFNKVAYLDKSVSTENKFDLPKFGITELLSYLISASSGDALLVKQTVCFSPIFIFQRFPRGPPLNTQNC